MRNAIKSENIHWSSKMRISLFLLIASTTLLGAVGCRNDAAEEKQVMSEILDDDSRVISGVKKYFIDNKLPVPDRIVISKKNDDVWLVLAGPQPKESVLEVDRKDGKVLKYSPGY